MKLGPIIRSLRQDVGISQQGVSDRLQELGFFVSQATIAAWELGRRTDEIAYNPDFIDALANTLETTPTEILRQLGFVEIPHVDGDFDDILADIASLPPAQQTKLKEALRLILDGMKAVST